MEKRPRDDHQEDEIMNSPVVIKKLRESLLENIDDESMTPELSDKDLASFMKTLEDEITVLPSDKLNFLLDASDDDLGLPVQGGEPETPVQVSAEPSSEIFWSDQPAFDELDPQFGFGEPAGFCVGGREDEYSVELDGLFDYSDHSGFGSGEDLWAGARFENLPARSVGI